MTLKTPKFGPLINHTYMYVCMYVCMYIYIYIYIYSFLRRHLSCGKPLEVPSGIVTYDGLMF